MAKSALRGKGRGGGGSNGRGGGGGRGVDPAGERQEVVPSAPVPGRGGSGRGVSGGGGSGKGGVSRGGGSGRGVSGGGDSGRGRGGGRGPAPEYIPLGELAAMAAARATKNRGKSIATTAEPVRRPVATKPSLKLGSSLAGGEDTTDHGGSPVARPTSNDGSSNSSNPSPPSHGTRVSNSNITAGRTIPLQYSGSSNSQGGSRRGVSPTLNPNTRVVGEELQRDDETDDDEEEDRDDEEDLEGDEEEPDFEAVTQQQPQGLDDAQLLANLLAIPGRQGLPLLSEVPAPDSLWFTRDRGKLTRVISTIFRRLFDGPFFSWTVTPIDKQERYFRTFASKYYWDPEITELVRDHFNAIAINRMKGIVSRAKRSGVRPIWINDDLWKEKWLHWALQMQ